MNSVFLLRALAAWKMLRQRRIRFCRAAVKPAIRAECSKDQRSNSHNADGVAIHKLIYVAEKFELEALTIQGVLTD